jgi:hypothetical protein
MGLPVFAGCFSAHDFPMLASTSMRTPAEPPSGSPDSVRVARVG